MPVPITTSMNGKIFISYSRADGEFARRLARDLRSANIDVWLDTLDIPPGAMWDQVVEAALQECTRMIVVLSPDAIASRPVMDEVSFALDENKTLLPVLYRPCDIPFRLRRIQFTDFTSGYVQGLSDLVRVFGLTVRPKGQAPPRSVYQASRPDPDTRSSTQRISATAQAAVSTQPRRGFWTRTWIAGHPRVDTALKTAFAGTLVSFATLSIPSEIEYPRVSPLLVLYGVVFYAALPWFIAGAIAGPRKVPLMWVFGTALFACISLWLLINGEMEIAAEALAVSLHVGLPAGGVLGALIGAAILRFRGEAEVR